MNFLSITEWAALAEKDPVAWVELIDRSVTRCIEKTDTSVVSWNLSGEATVANGPLAGVPYAAKELFDAKGWPTHSSSVMPMLLGRKAVANSEAVEQMHALGATCIAKTQMNEFAYGLSGENLHYGNCPHPTLTGCLTGGSSSGSAHMVAAGYVPLALGTDTGGSIRLPAAWCGLYGLRTVPGYKMRGCFPLAESFDTVGWFTRTSEDMALSLRAWFDLDTAASESAGLRGSFLMPESLVDADVSIRLKEVIDRLGLAAASSTEALESLMPDCNQAFNVLQSREAYSVHKEWLETHGDYYDPAVKARILRGINWTEDQVDAAIAMRELVTDWFEAYFVEHDFLVMPICPRASGDPGTASPDLREKILRLTAPASLAQKPTLTVPITLQGHATVGLQFIFKELDGSMPLRLLDLCKNI